MILGNCILYLFRFFKIFLFFLNINNDRVVLYSIKFNLSSKFKFKINRIFISFLIYVIILLCILEFL